jgi:hypothetical protein
MALPGGYRRSTEYDDETSALTEAVTASLGGRQESRLHVTFRTKSNNGLGQIVVRADLLDTAEKTQRSQFIRVLGDQGYSYDETLVYLQTGILPRLIRDTYSCYLSMLTEMAAAAINSPSHNWSTGLAYTMIKYHSNKLSLQRCQVASYRELMYLNYTYMRTAKEKKYYVEGISKELWNWFPAITDAEPGPTGTACATCKRNNLHPTYPTCPLLPLNAAARTRCLVGLKYRSAVAACQRVAKAFADDPAADHEEVITKAREGL